MVTDRYRAFKDLSFFWDVRRGWAGRGRGRLSQIRALRFELPDVAGRTRRGGSGLAYDHRNRRPEARSPGGGRSAGGWNGRSHAILKVRQASRVVQTLRHPHYTR